MKTLLTATTALSLLLAPLAAEAGPKGRGNGNGNGGGNGNGAWATGEFCPPGLAHRDPPCVPPGQARQAERDGDDRDREDRDRDDRDEDRSGGDREDDRDGSDDVIEIRDGDDRDSERALAIVGALTGLALLQQARREAQTEAQTEAETAPSVAAPAPFSFSEVPSRPAYLEALAASPAWGDAADPEPALADPVPAAAPVPSATPLVPPTPLLDPAPALAIPPAPPMAEDVTDLLGGADTGLTGY